MECKMSILIYSFNDICKSFITDRKMKQRSKRTIEFYHYNFDNFQKWLKTEKISQTNIELITTQQLKKYFIHLSETRTSGGTHAPYRAIRALLYFYEEEFEPDNWKNPIKKIKIENPKPEILDGIPIEHVKILIENTSGTFKLRDSALFSCLVDSGCRITEFLLLNIEDVDLISGRVFIKRENSKTKKSRVVFFGKDSRKYLRKYLKTRENLEPDSPLWINIVNSRLQYYGFMKIIKRNCDINNIPYCSPHDFRRCFAITLYRNGASVLDISNLLGHRSLEVTQRYLKIDEKDLLKSHISNNPIDNLRK